MTASTTLPPMRLVLCLLLTLASLPARASNTPSSDPLAVLMTQLSAPLDDQASAAAGASSENSARLARIQASLTVAAAGYESLRSPVHAAAAKEILAREMDPAVRPFVKDRDASLNAVYRTLAVVDYTWALRFPGLTCAATDRRRALLQSGDGLFVDPDAGTLSPWMERLLGPNSFGYSPEEALDRASAAAPLTPAAYEKLRVRANQLTEELSGGQTDRSKRAEMYCERAELYEQLAGAHRKTGPALASLSTGKDDVADESRAVFLLTVADGNNYVVLGAGFLVRTANGTKFVTDASIVRGHEKVYAFAHPASDGKLGEPMPVVIERISDGIGPAIGRLDRAIDAPALNLAEKSPTQDELVRGLGPLRIAGPWTVTQGLVIGAGSATFQSDAVLSVEMAGSPILNDRGEAAGLVIRRGEDVTALRVEKVRAFLDGKSVEPSDAEFIASRNSGSASLLTTARPVDTYAWSAPGASAIESGLPTNLGGVSWEGGSAERIGNDLGSALGDAAGKLMVYGMQKLFQGIYSLFHPQPGGTPDVAVKSKKAVPPPAPPPPPPEPKIIGLTLTAEPAEALPGESVTLVGQLQFLGDYKNKANIGVSLSVPADGRAVFAGGETSISATTDGTGRARAALTVVQKTEDFARGAFAELDARARGANVETRPAAHAEATAKRKAADAANSAQDALDAEEERIEPGGATEAASNDRTAAPDNLPPSTPPIEVSAASSGFSDVAEIKSPVNLYYTEALSAERMDDGTVTVIAQILTNDKAFDVSGVKVAFDVTSADGRKQVFAATTDRGGAAQLDVQFPQTISLASLPLEDAALVQSIGAGRATGTSAAHPVCTLLGAATTVGLCATAVLAPASGPAAPVTMGIVIIGAGIGGKFISDRCGAITEILSRATKPDPMPTGGNDGEAAGGKKDDALIGQSGDPNQHEPKEERAPLNRKLSDKIRQQMNDPRRNWSEKEIEDAFNNPRATEPSMVKSNGNPATRYFNRGGKFIVVDDVTGEVIQVGGIDFAENLPPLP